VCAIFATCKHVVVVVEKSSSVSPQEMARAKAELEKERQNVKQLTSLTDTLKRYDLNDFLLF
jgi:hypothetical protein